VKITKHAVAALEYTLTDDDGELLDSSRGRGPLAYIHGIGNLIPGLEQELEGKTAGDALSVRIAAADAYGERDESMVHTVPRDQLPQGAPIKVGMQLQAEGEGGTHVVRVVGVEADSVKLDANHPLAGVPLNFDVKVVEVRGATPDELRHGHVHGPGGHAH
jgi:FKBP-type peptidyl-prolyl cis-trans isomerase SlyD